MRPTDAQLIEPWAALNDAELLRAWRAGRRFFDAQGTSWSDPAIVGARQRAARSAARSR